MSSIISVSISTDLLIFNNPKQTLTVLHFDLNINRAVEIETEIIDNIPINKV